MVPPEEIADEYRYYIYEGIDLIRGRKRKSTRPLKHPDYFQSSWNSKKYRRSAREPFYRVREPLYCVYYAYEQGASKIYEGKAVRVYRCCTTDAVAESCNIDFVIDDQMRLKLRKSHKRTIMSMGYWYEIVHQNDLHKFMKEFLERPLALIE